MHARAVVAVRERDLAEVPGHDRLGDIVAPEATPAHQIGLGDEDPPVAPLATAGPAGQTIELFVRDRQHSPRIQASKPEEHHRGTHLPGPVPPPGAPLHSSLEIAERSRAPGIAAGPLHVVFASPEGEAERDAAVTVVFNKPMRSLDGSRLDAARVLAFTTPPPSLDAPWK